MTSHFLATRLVALGIVAAALPTDCWAAQGGRVAASPPAGRSAWHPPAVSSPRVLASPQMGNSLHGAANAFRLSRFRDRRAPGVLLGGFPAWWGYGDVPYYYASDLYGYPPDTVPAYALPGLTYPPVEPFPDRRPPLVVYGPGCRTDTQKVPSKAGGEHTINITRCY